LTETVNVPQLSQGQDGTCPTLSHQSPTTEIDIELDKDIKRLYMENVSMTETQHSNLIKLMGEQTAIDYMERYNVWITTKTPAERKRRDAYLSIRKWYTDAQKKVSTVVQAPSKRAEPKYGVYEQSQEELELMPRG
jgi:hypothetical protein